MRCLGIEFPYCVRGVGGVLDSKGIKEYLPHGRCRTSPYALQDGGEEGGAALYQEYLHSQGAMPTALTRAPSGSFGVG